jgi:hypothetical protein
MVVVVLQTIPRVGKVINSKETGGNFQSPSMPSKSSSNLRSNASSKLQCDVLRCAQLFF